MTMVTSVKAALPLVLLATLTAAGTTIAGGDAAAGKEKAAVCASCHGVDGNATISANPRLAGQYESYLYHSLKGYKSGERKNPVMSGMVAGLSDQDMRDLAAWYASQTGNALQVLPEE